MLIQITNTCTFGCPHCLQDSGPTPQHMPLGLFKNALILSKMAKCQFLMISGGEPTDHPDWENYLDLACNNDDGQAVTFITNGKWLGTDKEDIILDKLRKKFDVLIVDCQGIGSKLCHDGQQFLSKYYDRPMTQKVIYHSGLEPDPTFETILEEKGMRWYTKGRDPMGLVNLVQNYSVVHPHIRVRPPVDYAKTVERMKKHDRRRRRR